MSYVSQRKDISDPEVIHDFARKVGDQMRLDYLYTLTVADISATNPALWTTWRASLMRNLYVETRRALRRGLENPADKQQWIMETQANALSRLEKRGFTRDQVLELWDNPGDDFFLRESVNDIVWESEAIAKHTDKSKPLILIKESGDGQFSGATQIFVYAKNRPSFFALVAGVMAQLDLNIVDARIYSSRSDYTLDTFYVLNADGAPLGNDPIRVGQIHNALYEQLSSGEDFTSIVQRRTPRRLKYFSFPTITSMTTDTSRNCTILEVITADRPGLLARIGSIFVDFNIDLQTAKIATLGERVEDIFYITDRAGNPITDPELSEKIQTAIRQTLDQHSAQQGNGAVA
jgi:[protein-PII] uridylyltransferase